jgi:hypothetical protein
VCEALGDPTGTTGNRNNADHADEGCGKGEDVELKRVAQGCPDETDRRRVHDEADAFQDTCSRGQGDDGSSHQGGAQAEDETASEHGNRDGAQRGKQTPPAVLTKGRKDHGAEQTTESDRDAIPR